MANHFYFIGRNDPWIPTMEKSEDTLHHSQVINVMEDDQFERDMISKLPSSILGTILSFLSLRKAVRTILDADHSFGPHGWRVHQENLRFSLIFALGKNSSDLNSWIICATEKGIQELDLCLFERKYYAARDDDDYDDNDDLLIHYLDDWSTRPLCRLYDFPYHLLFGDGNAGEIENTPDRKPAFSNLKLLSIPSAFMPHLNLLCDFVQMPYILLLNNADYIDEVREIWWPSGYPKDYLKEVLIAGMHGYMSEIEIVVFLLNNAMALEKMVIDPCSRYYSGCGKLEALAACARWIGTRRWRVSNHLRVEVRPQVQLLIL
ncbi:hypothetical protein SLEP1_g57539 [Rubroshorea leprosula]|uniref:FBD domain-containing protein n=1 Tax=Rubroshorea leprosula TaxID=152421 RepID=A0AAV5MLJ1_9ROSI|nr:hypothetical protein SLEP1_g57539 [Rubroshorea leprosula]